MATKDIIKMSREYLTIIVAFVRNGGQIFYFLECIFQKIINPPNELSRPRKSNFACLTV
jgi:hypothetical protein